MALLRTLKKRFGISAPRVAVRAHLPWYWRGFGVAVVGAMMVGLGWVTYHFGMSFAGFRQSEAESALAKLKATLTSQQKEIAELRAQVANAERQLQIERATYGDFAKQVKSLAEENATLKEDLAFFHSLMPAGGGAGAISINRFKVQPEALPGEYRYRLLLVRAGQRAKEFQGRLQFIVNLSQNEKPSVLTLPPEHERNARDYQLNFKFYQRVEGTFKIAPDAVVKSLQVRVFENGSNAPKLTQTVNIS